MIKKKWNRNRKIRWIAGTFALAVSIAAAGGVFDLGIGVRADAKDTSAQTGTLDPAAQAGTPDPAAQTGTPDPAAQAAAPDVANQELNADSKEATQHTVQANAEMYQMLDFNDEKEKA